MQEVPAGARLGPSPGNTGSISKGSGEHDCAGSPFLELLALGRGSQNSTPAQLRSVAEAAKPVGAGGVTQRTRH